MRGSKSIIIIIIFIWFYIYNKVRDDENIAIENYTATRRKGTGVIIVTWNVALCKDTFL